MKRNLLTFAAAAALVLGLTACGSASTQTATTAETAESSSAAAKASSEQETAESTEVSAQSEEDSAQAALKLDEPVTVRIGLTGVFNEDIWAPAAETLKKENINLEFVQFSNFSLPNEALANGDIEMNAFQHHAYLKKEKEDLGYQIDSIGDMYVVTMAIFSDKLKSLDEVKDGDTVAIPNDLTNEGRALRLLEEGGLIQLKADAGASPTIDDIETYNKKIEFVELDANMIASSLPDVTLAVINGNYAVDNGLKAEDALLQESESSFTDNRYFGLIAVRSEDVENPVYKRIVEVFQSEPTKQVFETEFSGFFLPAWELDVPDYQ